MAPAPTLGAGAPLVPERAAVGERAAEQAADEPGEERDRDGDTDERAPARAAPALRLRLGASGAVSGGYDG